MDRAQVSALLQAYQGADAQHSLQINDIRLLPRPRQEELRIMERELVHIFGDAIGQARPELADSALLAPITMSLFGMLNWAYLWLKPGGAMSREEYADLVTTIVVDGGHDVQILLGQRTKAGKRLPREPASKRKKHSSPRA